MSSYPLADWNLRFARSEPMEILAFAAETFGTRWKVASSFGAEDMVLVHMVGELQADALQEGRAQPVRVFMLDTGRLHEETYQVMERARQRYQIEFEVYLPDENEVRAQMAAEGPFSFYASIEARKACCYARKVEPLRRALRDVDAWVTGQRRAQSVTRGQMDIFEYDEANGGLVKINPLASWSEADVWRFIDDESIPTHGLHDVGYPSIGCAPCTRPVSGWARGGQSEGLVDLRAGRWWWESPDSKECGLHGQASAGAAR